MDVFKNEEEMHTDCCTVIGGESAELKL